MYFIKNNTPKLNYCPIFTFLAKTILHKIILNIFYFYCNYVLIFNEESDIIIMQKFHIIFQMFVNISTNI